MLVIVASWILLLATYALFPALEYELGPLRPDKYDIFQLSVVKQSGAPRLAVTVVNRILIRWVPKKWAPLCSKRVDNGSTVLILLAVA